MTTFTITFTKKNDLFSKEFIHFLPGGWINESINLVGCGGSGFLFVLLGVRGSHLFFQLQLYSVSKILSYVVINCLCAVAPPKYLFKFFLQQQLWTGRCYHLHHQWLHLCLLCNSHLFDYWLPSYAELWWLHGRVSFIQWGIVDASRTLQKMDHLALSTMQNWKGCAVNANYLS